jgi:hypothetical protein
MKTFLLICTASVAATMAAATKSDAMSINAGVGIKPVIAAIDMMQKAQVFIVDGRCLYRKLDSAIMVMKAAENGRRYDAAPVLDGPMDR